MKKILFILFIWSFMCINVHAATHDVQAKYEQSYNVKLYTVTLNNDTKRMNIDNYSLAFSTPLKDIEVVVIKVENEENNYVKSFTKSDNNYYIVFYKDGKKITTSNINIDIMSENKVLNIYDNNGKIINISSDSINLDSNNYFMMITDKIVNNDSSYRVIDIDSFLHDIEDIAINDNSNIQIYNHKNIIVDNTKKLGTGYRVIINNAGNISEYKIIAKGDITGDAKINLNDITRLYHYYKKIEQMDDVFVLAGDVANNDVINLNDITKLYHYYKDIIQSL